MIKADAAAGPAGGSGGMSENGGSKGQAPDSGVDDTHRDAGSGAGGGGAGGGGAGGGGSGGSPMRDAAVGSDASGGSVADSGASGRADAAGPVPGTMSLFDGTTLNGWLQSSKMWWSVKDGVIDGKSTTGGELLMTKDDYGDFRLIVSSRMPFNAGGGHLGICFWGGRAPIGGYNACKLYIPPNPWAWDYSKSNGQLATTTFTTTATQDASVWHRTEILCRLATGHCLAAVDGKLIMTYTEQDLHSIKSGPLGLQIHSGNSEVQYKDVYVDPAPQVDQLLTLVP